MIERLTEWLMKWCEKRGRVLTITGTGGPEDVYLIRYYVVRSRFFNVFIHQFLRSDRDDLHDHPWDFFTYLVRGAYTEKKWDEKQGKVTETRRRGPPVEEEFSGERWAGICPPYQNRLVVRRATDQHQVLVDYDYKLSEKHLAPLTICVTGRTKREWGFVKTWNDGVSYNGIQIKPNTRAWIPWREYLGLPPDAASRG